jgi:hypothetical protein
VANKQLTFREVLLPALNKSIDRLKVVITAAGDWLVEKVNSLADSINGFVTGIQNNTYLSPVYSLISWIPKTVDNIRDWATDKVHWVFDKIVDGVEYLRKFIDPIITMLQKIVTVVGDLLGHLPDFILGVPFMFLPKCIKDPIIKWLTEVILKKIPIIAEFIELTEKWEEIKTAALTVIKQIFVDGQLGKGLWTFFKTLLTILGIDPTLVTTVVAKAAQNFSDIISKPGDFLKNVWLVLKGGFKRFFDNILIHLPAGALNWLFGEVKGAVSVSPPKDFTLGSILGYVMDLFGITKENVYKRMEENPRIGPKKVARIRQIESALTGALEWITVWIKEGPAGLLRKAKEKLDDIVNMVINGIVSWVTTKITAEIMQRLATSSDPLGIGATINTIILIYDTIKTAVAYINKMLNLANQAMDNLAEIIAGRVEKAQEAFEKVLAKAVPIVIGFAVEVIIGPVADKIKEIVTDARKVVDDAIDWLINGALDMIGSLIEFGKSIVQGIFDWARAQKDFKSKSGMDHKIFVEKQGGKPVLKVASSESLLSILLEDLKSKYEGDNEKLAIVTKCEKLLKTINNYLASIRNKEEKAENAQDDKLKTKMKNQIEDDYKELIGKETLLTANLSEIIDKATDFKDPNIEIYGVEGLVGVHKEAVKKQFMFEADHQPSNKVIEEAANSPDAPPILKEINKGRTSLGTTITLHVKRHMAGRTWGSKAKPIANAFKEFIKNLKGSKKTKEEKINGYLKSEARQDAEHIINIVKNNDVSNEVIWGDLKASPDKKKIKNMITNQIISGENTIKNQEIAYQIPESADINDE